MFDVFGVCNEEGVIIRLIAYVLQMLEKLKYVIPGI
jgi:hypothetical protein